MKTYEGIQRNETIFLGIDLHKTTWYVTARTKDQELFTKGIPGKWWVLEHLLDCFSGCRIKAVYEAGYFGYWLHDKLNSVGVECIVTPPSLIPQQYGNKVKTDRRDSHKLALLFSKGLLKGVYVPSRQELSHRQVLRRRTQLIQNRVRTQNRIKAELRFYGIEAPTPQGRWSKSYIQMLGDIQFDNNWCQQNFKRLLEEFEFLTCQIEKQTQLLKEMSKMPIYKNRVAILTSIPGVGTLTALEILLELHNMERFRRSEQIAAYVGLTPAQYSSGDKVRMGRITGIGKSHLRATLVEASWQLIRRDESMRKIYERIKHGSGAKRAIVGIARRLLLIARKMLIENQMYKRPQAA